MADDRVARVYAAALFEAAQDAGRTPQVQADLGQFDAAMAASSALRGALLDPQVERAGKQRVLADLTRRRATSWCVNALRLMLQKGRIALRHRRPRRVRAPGRRGGARGRRRGHIGRGRSPSRPSTSWSSAWKAAPAAACASPSR